MNRTFRLIQPISAGAVAFAHGSNDAQKTMGIITLALVTSGHLSEYGAHPDVGDHRWRPRPWRWAPTSAAGASSTRSGTKVIKLDPIHGVAAETSAASVIYGAGHFFGFPISTTQTITASIMGAGATGGLSAVKWGVAGNIAWAWVLTLPAAAGVAALVVPPAERRPLDRRLSAPGPSRAPAARRQGPSRSSASPGEKGRAHVRERARLAHPTAGYRTSHSPEVGPARSEGIMSDERDRKILHWFRRSPGRQRGELTDGADPRG